VADQLFLLELSAFLLPGRNVQAWTSWWLIERPDVATYSWNRALPRWELQWNPRDQPCPTSLPALVGKHFNVPWKNEEGLDSGVAMDWHANRNRWLNSRRLSGCHAARKLGDWRSLIVEGVSSFSTFFNCAKRGEYGALIGDCVRTCVVSHLHAEAARLAMGVIYFFEERSRNVNMIAGLLFKYNSRGWVSQFKCSIRGLFSIVS